MFCDNDGVVNTYRSLSFGNWRFVWGASMTGKEPHLPKWEPHAATWTERIDALVEAHRLGIKTWVSIEPVINPDQSLALISMTHALRCVDLYRIGTLNHEETPFPKTNLYDFV